MINTSEFRWKDITVIMLGRPIVRLLDVKYKKSVQKKVLRGRGGKGLGIAEGNEDYNGSIRIGQSELEALIRRAKELFPGATPTEFPPFDIVVNYQRNGIVVTDIIKSASLVEFEKAMSQGQEDMEIDLPFIALDVEYDKTGA